MIKPISKCLKCFFKTKLFNCFSAIVMTISLLLVSSAMAEEVTLSAAASLTNAVKAIAECFTKNHPDINIRHNFGSSGSLAKQIAQGASTDIFISANPKWMDYLKEKNKLKKKNKIDPSTIRLFTKNTLVFIGTAKETKSFSDIQSLTRIAIASPKSAPAGQYAAQAMSSAGVYESLVSKKLLAIAKDVRQALMYAERGEVEGAFVYKTDALLAQNAEILFAISDTMHDPIEYPIGMTFKGKSRSSAKSFYQFLLCRRSQEILHQFGFQAQAGFYTQAQDASIKKD